MSTRFSLSVENEQADAEFSGANRDREKIIFPVQLTTSKIGNLTRLIHTLLYGMTIHTYMLWTLCRGRCECRTLVSFSNRDEGPFNIEDHLV